MDKVPESAEEDGRLQALRESEQKFAAAFEHSPNAVAIADERGRFVEVNKALTDLLGRPAKDLLGRNVVELGILSDAERARLLAALEQPGSGREPVELQFRLPDGTVRDVVFSVQPITVKGVPHRLAVINNLSELRLAQAARSESEARLRQAVQAAGIGVWDWDLRTNRLHCAPEWGREGNEREEDFNEWRRRVHPDDLPALDAAVQRVLQEQQPHLVVEYRLQRADGTLRWIRAQADVWRDEEGKPIRLLGCHVDVTADREAEHRMRQLNRTHELVSGINHLIVRETDAAALLQKACDLAVGSGGFLLAWFGRRTPDGSLSVAAHAGATPETVRIIEGIFTDPSRGCAITQEAIQTGSISVCAEIAHDPRAADWREAALERGYRAMVALPLVREDRVVGTLNLYAAEAGFFDRDELNLLHQLVGDLAFAIGTLERETARQRAEAELRISEERFRELAETVQEVFWISSPEKDRVIYVSPAYEKIWGRSRQQLYDSPKDWLEAVHPEDRDRVAQVSRAQQAIGGYNQTYRVVRPDGVVRWVNDRAFPVRDGAGAVVRIVGTAQDITERREIEEQYLQAQKMEAFGQLAGGVAHDFNNILAVIIMQAELLALDREVPPEMRENLELVLNSAQRGAQLARQLLLFSHKQVLQPRDLDLNEVVESLTQMLQRLLEANIRLELHLHPSPLMVHADPGMLDQVLLNLAVNARDAMPKGGRLLIATSEQEIKDPVPATEPEARRGRFARIVVKDTGTGIAPEVLPRIFEPFFTTKESGKGTGLGLATVFGIVQQHQGWVDVQSEPGRGATFTIWLPALECRGRSAPSEPAWQVQGGKETILLVEDDPAVRTVTRAVLARVGYRVLEARDAAEALRIWEQSAEEIDLLFTDLVMPGGLGGRELAGQLQERRPSLRIVMTSGYSADLSGRPFALPPGQAFLQKPCSPQQLLQTVRRCLDST